MDKRKNILIFLSDQHSAMIMNHDYVKTPHLNKLAGEGTTFTNAYTSCPLCVPSRSSMLTGQLPSKTGIFTNSDTIPEDMPTFLHQIANAGYETVLCGRMHYIGDNQRHGFTKRLVGDICPTYWGKNMDMRESLGDFKGTLNVKNCLTLAGKGDSPVLSYDRQVIKAALEYLEGDYDKPQCIVVGTYGPHFPYVAPEAYFDYYREIVKKPESIQQGTIHKHEAINHKKQYCSEDRLLDARAAYFGMIEQMDSQIGEVKEAWDSYLSRHNVEGVFFYLSDHGDQIGEKDLYGKQTFYEGSARIPMVVSGVGVKANYKINTPVSIMDIGPTVCDIIGAPVLHNQDGKSIYQEIFSDEKVENGYVISEFIEENSKGELIPGRMVKYGDYKLISYYEYDIYDELYNTTLDPFELHNIIHEKKVIGKKMKDILEQDYNPIELMKKYRINKKNHDIIAQWANDNWNDQKEMWNIPKNSSLFFKN